MAKLTTDFDLNASITATVPDGLSGDEEDLAEDVAQQKFLIRAMGVTSGPDFSRPCNQDRLRELASQYNVSPERALKIFNAVTISAVKGDSTAGHFDVPIEDGIIDE